MLITTETCPFRGTAGPSSLSMASAINALLKMWFETMTSRTRDIVSPNVVFASPGLVHPRVAIQLPLVSHPDCGSVAFGSSLIHGSSHTLEYLEDQNHTCEALSALS
jgi:hypothetical protein